MNKSIIEESNKVLKTHLSLIIITILFTFLSGFISIIKMKLTLFNYREIIFLYIQLIFILLLCLLVSFYASKKYRNHYFVGIIISSVFGISISLMMFTNTNYFQLYCYFITLTLYHYSEYISVLLYHFKGLAVDKFLIDQSKEWIFSCIFSILKQ